MKRVLSLILAFVFVVGICASVPITANAASVDDLTFELNSDRQSYSVKDCSYSVNGEMVIPATHNGLPVTSIGYSAFYDCNSLTSITIPDSVTSIGGSAFWYCTSLTSITIPDSITSIGNRAFGNCESLTSITIPDSVTSIGDSAFSDCDSLTNITIPDGVTSIAPEVFYSCSSLTSITIPGSVTSIGYNAFSGCSLTSITIPDGVTSIAKEAFCGCDSLTSVRIPDSVTSIGYSAFRNCTSLTSVYITDITSWCNINYSYDYNYNYHDANPLCNGADLYLNGELVAELTIPEGVTEIMDDAFNGCTSLTSVTIPDSVTSIGDSAFEDCTSLTSVTIPDSVTSIGDDAFEDCTSLTSITIPDSVTSIGDSAFIGCKSLASITISDSVTRIGNSTFNGCSSLTSITIPDSVTSIGGYAFGRCDSITSITIPDSVTSIGHYAFCNCPLLTSVTIPSSVRYIEGKAFGYICDLWEEEEYKIEGFTIYGEQGSEAEKYANENDFTFVEVVLHTHSYTESITKQPTCAETGTKTFTCSCGDSYTTPVAALGHNYSNEYTIDKAPTYDEEGSESRHCIRCGARTGERAIPKLVRLSAPTILTTESTENGVKFTWSAVEGADGYTVFKLTQDATGNYVYKELATVGKATLAFTDKTAVDGETYCYAVCAMDNYGATSPYAEFAFTYVKPIPLATPTVKVANTAKGIKVTWNKVDNAQKYVVYRRFYSPTNKKWSGWIALNSNCKTTSFVDTTTKIGINYRYTVKAVNGKSASAFKSTPTIKYNVVPTVTVANASNGIKVSWSAVANATGYTVYSSTYNTKTKKWSSWKNRGTAGKNKTVWVDKSAKAGTIYKYTVRAVCGSNASSFKASSSLVRLLNPTVKAVKASNGIKVTWNKIAGAKNYKIYRAQYANGKWSGWSGIATTNNKTFAYVDKTAKKGVYYKYTVRAVNGKSASAFTASKNVKR